MGSMQLQLQTLSCNACGIRIVWKFPLLIRLSVQPVRQFPSDIEGKNHQEGLKLTCGDSLTFHLESSRCVVLS